MSDDDDIDSEDERVNPNVLIASMIDETNSRLENIENLLSGGSSLGEGKKEEKETPPPEQAPPVITATPPNAEYYDKTRLIENSVATTLPPDSDQYQYESIYLAMDRPSLATTIINIGPGLLIIRVSWISKNGITVSDETTILEGDSNEFDKIYDVRLRSPTANLQYRVTERKISSVTGQRFTGIRFKERRDRKGVIVFQDDMESPTLKFSKTIVGLGTIARSTDISYSGDFSIKVVTGGVVGDTSAMIYFHPDFHEQKVGIQVQFSSDSVIYDLHLVIDFFDGMGNEFFADVFTVGGSAGGNSLIAIDENGNDVILVSGVGSDIIQIFEDIHSPNVMKLVVDLATHKYVSAEINGKKINFDLSIQNFGNNLKRHIEAQVLVAQTDAVVYIDNYIFTEDET